MQFIKVHWNNERQPLLLLYDLNGKFQMVDMMASVNIKFSQDRRCIGSYNLNQNDIEYCENPEKNLKLINGRCNICEQKTGFSDCLICNGTVCRAKNIDALNYCKQPHLVYLAYFPNNIVKVGTALEKRLNERLLEQGAIYAYTIAKGSGKTARLIENEISSIGITKSVSNNYKLNNLIYDMEIEDIYSLLKSKYLYIRKSLKDKHHIFFDNPEIICYESIVKKIKQTLYYDGYQLSLFGADKALGKNYLINNSDSLKGTVLFGIGQIIVSMFEDKIYATNTKRFAGYLLE